MYLLILEYNLIEELKIKDDVMVGELIACLVGLGLPTISAAALPLLIYAIPSWKQQYHEWSVASSQKLKLEDDASNGLYGRLKESLLSVKGQDLQKEVIIDSICGWSESKKNNLDCKLGGLVIHLAGVSGTGKSMVANILANELSKDSAIRISYSSINTFDNRSCADQLFGSYIRIAAGNVKVKCNTEYSAQLMHNPNVIVQIDEFDKFMMRDDSLQALLWDISDTGRLKIDKDTYIDCSDTIFILTSNASRESLKMKMDKLINDDSDTLELVNFKQAFLNRIVSVYFEDFSQETYKEILVDRLESIKNYYLEKYNMVFNFNDDVLNKISNELVGMKTGGARNIGIFTRKLYSAINYFKRRNGISESYNENKYDLDVSYNDKKFEICSKNEVSSK